MSELYEFYKKHGICVQCGQEKAVRNQTLCYACRANKRDVNKASYEKHRKERLEKTNAYKKNLYEERKRLGLCTVCGKRRPETGRVSCGLCLAKDRRRHERARLKKGVIPHSELGNGIYCYTCGKNVENPESKLCNNCYENACKNLEIARSKITKTGRFYKPFIFGKKANY